MPRLATQKISDEMHAFLWKESIKLDESIASVVRGLIRKSMEESEAGKKIDLSGLPMDLAHSLIGANLRDRSDVIYYVNMVGPLNHIDGIGLKSVDTIMRWLEV